MNKVTYTYRRKMLLSLCDIPTYSEPEITAMKGPLPNRITAIWSNRDLRINDQYSIIAGKRKSQKGV